ncbi:MAG: translation initiation factor 2, partial [Actinobacteria bacterium 13_1_20CM_3_71_11]
AGPPVEPPAPPPYAGPPRPSPPPRDWRPRLLIQPPPPRELPAQDLAALDAQDREARTVTYGVGMVAGAVLLIVLLILCGRILF